MNLRCFFDRIFSIERGCGYPTHRKEPQQAAIRILANISALTHRPFAEIIAALPDDVLLPALRYPGMQEVIDIPSIVDSDQKATFVKRLG